ncbi:Concanavalin A-like lectin/glucanases superfamily [Candidatus Nanopelagicaceae bacterium]
MTGLKASSTTADAYSQGFGYTCTSFNSNGTLSSITTYTEVFVWGTSTTDLNQSCPTGKVGIGVQVDVASSMVRQFALICGNPMSHEGKSTLSYIPNTLTGGTPTTYTCPTGKVLVGFNTKTGAGMDQMTPRCATYTGFEYAAVGLPSITSSSVHTATVAFTAVDRLNSSDTPETFTVTATSSIGTIETATGLSSPITISNLRSNVSYTITVTGANTFGSSPATGSVSLAAAVLPGSDTDTALSLNGSSQYAWTESSSAIGITNAFSLEAWVKPETITAGNWNLVICKEGVLQFGFQVVSNVAYWHYGISSSATLYANVNTYVPVRKDEWQHIAITRAENTNSVDFYLNGVKVFTGSADQASSGAISNSTTHPFSIGARRNSSGVVAGYFGGQIDHVRIFNAARTSTEILNGLKTYTTSNDAGLVAYYDFNEESGSYVFNRKIGALPGSDLKLSGSVGWKHVAEESTTATAPYTVIKFPRTYLTSSGGWKVPTNVSKVSVLVVAGGGGGGGGGYSTISPAGGGGGGGSGGTLIQNVTVSSGALYEIKVGTGGDGGAAGYNEYWGGASGTNGTDSTAFSLTATGGYGGKGAGFNADGTTHSNYTAGIGGQSGNGFTGGTKNTNTSNNGGNSGGGATGNGSQATSSTGASGGSGISNIYSGTTTTYASGGAGGTGSSSGGVGSNGSYGTGNGGVGGNGAVSSTPGKGGSGGSGVVIVRWITASVPTYTKPTTAYLNVGMTETFTTNVAQDSATAVLTRTFKWESTTPAANGAYTLIKQGTGAANAAFSWIPTDTATSGSGYLYRLTVTDSDTAGLFITDSSTAYAVINRALVVSGSSSFGKTINLAKSETYTITLGTPTYRASLSPTIAGITLDTSTAGSAVIKISETMTVGTYYETLTVLDSVSASVVTPLTIIVAAPPNLVNTGEIVGDGLIFNLDFANSASFDRGTRTAKDISGSNKPITIHNSPLFKDENLGHLDLNSSSSQYVSATGFTTLSTWTIDTYFRLDSTSQYSCIVSSEGASSTATRNLALCVDATTPRIYAGFYDGVSWTYIRTTETIPLNTWTHVAAEWDGLTSNATTSVKIWIDGTQATNYQWYTRGTTAAAASSSRIYINHDPLMTVSSYTDLSIGYVRIYNRALSFAEIAQNYNATKSRFLTANVDMVTPSHKYGNTTTETFTITSGYGSDTISYATGNKAGVKLETTTAQVTLKMQESLTATTHYETITVTDSLGASTYLPIKMTVSKADTLTISMDTKTVVTFNNAPITSYPKPVIKGLAGLDTFTVTTKFSSSLYTKSATVPTNSDTYTVIAEDPVFGIGALSNYVNVVYETSTAVVNKAKQPALSVFLYGGTVGLPFPITVSGGGGDGAISETVTAGSSMTGCAITNHSVSASSTSQGFCRVYIFKAASQNYLSESITVDMYFMAYINNQPTGQVGSGSTIAINGVTSFETSTVTPPAITSFNLSSAATLTSIEINGSGFSQPGLVIKFNRNKIAGAPSSLTDDKITVMIPSGAITGRVVVITQNGEAVSPQSLTITP